jgi:hypothetical protein
MKVSKPTAFELAQTAITLCQLHGKDLEQFPPERYFDKADSLLAKARTYINEEQVRREALNHLGSDLLDTAEGYRIANRPIPFECLLRPIDRPSKGKKLRTQVGTVTTEGGLEKAIRRYFSPSDASRIIKARSLTGNEWDQLINAQKNAVRNRAAKRVKGTIAEKSQRL